MTRTRRDPFPLFLQRLLIAESKERGVGSLWWLKKTDLWLLLEYNAALEVRSGILTQPGQYLSENVRNTLKLCFDCCVLCMENSKEVFVCCRNKTKYEEDSFSVFIQRLTSSTIASVLSVRLNWCFEFLMKKGYISAHKSRGWQCHYNKEYI